MGAYYYAGDEKIELEADDDHVAVDKKLAKDAGLDSHVKTASASAPPHVGGVVLTERAALGVEAVAELRKAGALQPVYRRDRAVMVALPDIRIEFETPEQQRAVMEALGKSGSQYTIIEESDDRIVVRPTSGNGADALTIANQIYEEARPAAASVRFIQFVPKTSVVRS